MIPIRPPSGGPWPEGPTRPGRDRRLGAPHRPAAVAGARRRRLPRCARADRAVLGAMATPSGWRRCSSCPCRRPGGPPAHRSRAGTGRVQGAGRGCPLPRARAAPHGGHRPPAAPGRPPARARRPGPGRVAGGPRRGGRPVRHRADPPRGALAVPRAALRARGHVATGAALDPGRLWARRQPLECAGTPAFGLPPAEELVVLAAHAGKPYHGFVRLVWIADLAMIVGAAARSGAAVDWDRVRAVAGAARCMTVVGVALAMARRAGVDAPTGLFPLPAGGWRGDAMGRLLSVTWPLTHLELPGPARLRADRFPVPARQILLVLLPRATAPPPRARLPAAGCPHAVPRSGPLLGPGPRDREDGVQGVEHCRVACRPAVFRSSRP